MLYDNKKDCFVATLRKDGFETKVVTHFFYKEANTSFIHFNFQMEAISASLYSNHNVRTINLNICPSQYSLEHNNDNKKVPKVKSVKENAFIDSRD